MAVTCYLSTITYGALQRSVVPQRLFVAKTFTTFALVVMLVSILRFDVYAMTPFVPLAVWWSMVVAENGAEALPSLAGTSQLLLLQLIGSEPQ